MASEDAPVSVRVSTADFNAAVRILMTVVEPMDPVMAGAALLAVWLLQNRGFVVLGVQEGVAQDVVDTVNRWSVTMTKEI